MALIRGILNIFKPGDEKEAARKLYEDVMLAARQPALYADLKVPDTLNGRFDMVVLHAYLVMRRLKGAGDQARDVSQALFDAMFADMDDALRGLGIGDTGVGKRIKKMAEAFYGRAQAYDQALGNGADADKTMLSEALARNVWPVEDGESVPDTVESLAEYVISQASHVNMQPVSALVTGDISFLLPADVRNEDAGQDVKGDDL